MKKSVLIILGITISSFSFAQSQGGGNGGVGIEAFWDGAVVQLTEFVGDDLIKSMGKSQDQEISKLLASKNITSQQLTANLKEAFLEYPRPEFVDHDLEIATRTCMNYPTLKKIICNRNKFATETLNGNIAFTTVLHEFLGYLNIETNVGNVSEYPISKYIAQFASLETRKVWVLKKKPIQDETDSTLEEISEFQCNKQLFFSSKPGRKIKNEIEDLFLKQTQDELDSLGEGLKSVRVKLHYKLFHNINNFGQPAYTIKILAHMKNGEKMAARTDELSSHRLRESLDGRDGGYVSKPHLSLHTYINKEYDNMGNLLKKTCSISVSSSDSDGNRRSDTHIHFQNAKTKATVGRRFTLPIQYQLEYKVK